MVDALLGRGRRAWIPVLCYAALILGLSSIPAQSMPDVPSLWRWDKLIHACEYAGFAWFMARALQHQRPLSAPLTILLAVAVAAAFGLLDELYQSTTPGRDSSLLDALADFVGASFGSSLRGMLYSRSTRHPPEQSTDGHHS